MSSFLSAWQAITDLFPSFSSPLPSPVRPCSKEEKPTLAALGSACTHAAHAQPPPLLLIIPPCDRGVQVKTRKRNIVVPSDPGSFSDAVVQIIQDAGENKGSEADLEAGAKALDAAELEYARYGDTLFEVFFTGGRLATGATLAEGGARLQQNVGTPRGWVAMNTRHAWGAQYQA
eukprot:1075592-Pelagomonas_calceolata.AAC.2